MRRSLYFCGILHLDHVSVSRLHWLDFILWSFSVHIARLPDTVPDSDDGQDQDKHSNRNVDDQFDGRVIIIIVSRYSCGRDVQV